MAAYISWIDRDFALTVIVALSLTFSFWMNSREDPYGLFHLSLNKLPGGDPDDPPKTEWLNMGYWRETKVFPEAAKALAMKLITAANLKEGGTVLDVGHGTGESLILLLSEPSIPRSSHIVGITSLKLHHERSAERIEELKLSHPEVASTRVQLYHGDAVCKDGLELQHRLRLKAPVFFDSILALDCAYHFDTRRRFLEQALRQLAPGGSIALADMCFTPIALSKWWMKSLTKYLRLMPLANVISDADYVAQMKELGYVDVVLEDITADVFPGFVKFLKSRGVGWWMFAHTLHLYTGVGIKFVIIGGKKAR